MKKKFFGKNLNKNRGIEQSEDRASLPMERDH